MGVCDLVDRALGIKKRSLVDWWERVDEGGVPLSYSQWKETVLVCIRASVYSLELVEVSHGGQLLTFWFNHEIWKWN